MRRGCCGRAAWPLAALLASPSAALAQGAAAAPDTLRPIAVHMAGTGDVAGMKKFIELSVLACRGHKGLPLNAPIPMPADATLAKLRLLEREELFDGAQHAEYTTQRMVAADARSGDCPVRLFHYRTARAGQRCGDMHHADSTLMGPLIDVIQPEGPAVTQRTQRDSLAGCGRPNKPMDTAGLPLADAGQGVTCVWQLDVVAKSWRALGRTSPGHTDSTAQDTCLYSKQPAYFHNGKRQTVVVHISGRPEIDPMNQVHGVASALLGQNLVQLTDGTPIAARRFTAAAAWAHVSQPAITAVSD